MFGYHGELTGRRFPRLELGGPEPSAILTPLELSVEIDRLAPDLSVDVDSLGPEAAERFHAPLERIQTALIELAKFIPAGADAVPASAHHSADGTADQRARPERYTRRWMDSELQRWRDTQRRLVTRPHPVPPEPRPRQPLDRAQTDAHRAWLKRGRTGEGRLTLASADLRPARLVAVELDGSRWEKVDVGRGNLDFIHLSDADLIEVDFTQCSLNYAHFTGARIDRCTFDGGLFGLGKMDQARLTGCSLERLWMDRSTWRGAQVQCARMRLADFGSSWLDGAHFAECDLRDTRFVPIGTLVRGSSDGAVFEHCDLRGADFTGRDLTGVTFAACLLRGATGAPAATGGWRVIDADFSAFGDGSDLGGASELLAQLSQRHDRRMTARGLRYSVGSEHYPADPSGRSELAIQADGRARLDHHFPRQRGSGSWTGQVDADTVYLARHQAAKLPGYAQAFDLLDAVIRQLSQGSV